MMEPSYDRREDVVGGKKGVGMESDERILTVFENEVDDYGSGMLLNGEGAELGFVDDGKFGANIVKSNVGGNVSEVCEIGAINLVVDLKGYDCNVVESRVKKSYDVEISEKEGEYEFSDLVWGKVKNHQWWPGQIINPSGSTDEAMKCFKKGRFLVGYFGCRKFAYNELNAIKPFRINFCNMVNQSSGETFNHAVNYALREAARRVEFGLKCLCLPQDEYDRIKSQIVFISGIRKESSVIDGGDRFSTVNSFDPAKTVDFLQDFAKDPFGINRLDVSTVGGQLSAFNRLKGYHQLQLNQVLDEVDYEFDATNSAYSKPKPNAHGRPRKFKHLFDSGFSPRKKVRCLSELMSDGIESLSNVEYIPKKRGRKRKLNECNGSGDESQSQTQTADKFLSWIYLTARNSIEGKHNLDSMVKFFSGFKNYRMRENKNDEEIANRLQTIETNGFTDVKDFYSTNTTTVTTSDKENSATALTFKFSNLDCVPSVKRLHEIFRLYGDLQENETRVLKKKKCVKLVFERKCDAATAFSSTGKFSIFGPALVSYRLNFSPTLRKTQLAKRGEISKATAV